MSCSSSFLTTSAHWSPAPAHGRRSRSPRARHPNPAQLNLEVAPPEDLDVPLVVEPPHVTGVVVAVSVDRTVNFWSVQLGPVQVALDHALAREADVAHRPNRDQVVVGVEDSHLDVGERLPDVALVDLPRAVGEVVRPHAVVLGAAVITKSRRCGRPASSARARARGPGLHPWKRAGSDRTRATPRGCRART